MNPYSMYKIPLPIIILITIWVLFWKGYALWTASKNNHKGWFVAILILNTGGILDIIYLFWIAKKKWSDVKRVFLKIVLPKKKIQK
ncbi:MAG: DUF5652 family protein [Candidatus Paceibacterota bacterium]|jgi:hypothetical protein